MNEINLHYGEADKAARLIGILTLIKNYDNDQFSKKTSVYLDELLNYISVKKIPIEWIDRVDSFFDNFCDYYGDNFYILPYVTRLAIDEIKENYNKYAHKAMIDSKLCECDED